MRKSIFLILVMMLMFAPTGTQADEVAPPTADHQQAFTDQFWKAVESGDPQALEQLSQEVTTQADGIKSQQEAQMLRNLREGKAADGGVPKGFRGDPNDPGPSDLSEWNFKTDKDGNVIGFEEKDAQEKDTNGDGEVSNEERDAWHKNKDEERKKNGDGPPGDNYKDPDWDDNPPDGNPDADFERYCWQCVKGVEPHCQDGAPGPCGGDACQEKEECYEHTETFKDRSLICHSCGPTEKNIDLCPGYGYFSDPACGNQCPPIACAPIDVDKKSGQIIPSLQTRERGSTQQCFACMDVTSIEVTWVVIIIETPYERFVLGKEKNQDAFKPTSVMALAKVDKKTGKMQNAAGQLKDAKSFLGSFNVGMGPMGLPSMGQLSMDQLSGLLSSELNSSGKAGSKCFDNVLEEADKKAAEQGTPTSKDIDGTSRERTKQRAKGEAEVFSEQEIKEAQSAGPPAVSGPIVACGNEGNNKVLRIYDASGKVIDTITQAMLKANPGIITEKLGLAQQLADSFIAKTGFDFASYVEKFTGLPLKDMQAVAAQVAQVKAQADQVAAKGKKKKKKGPETFVPNDPLYKISDAQKKKAKAKSEAGNIVIGSGMTMMGQVMGASASMEKSSKESPIKDQYALQVIGFTPYDDPNSAWNVVDANEKNVVVAVIDSGLDMTHPDGPQYIWTNPKEIPGNGIDDDHDGFTDDIHGWNFVNENHDFTDVRGHGTFVAGIIAAKTNNGIGIAGINPGAVIMPIKVADEEGVTNALAIYRGINYAVNHGAKVINVSLGGRTISKLEQIAVERAHAMGALVVVASGNGNDYLMAFGPSSSKQVLSVGQIDFSGERSTVSNWGPNLGLVAPGERIYSLCSKDDKHVLPSVRKAGYFQLDGTSFSTPMVAATASLIWAKNPDLTNQQVADLIRSTAKDMGDRGWDGMTGAGVLNAAAALRADAGNKLIVMLTNVRFNRDTREKIVSVDVFGTVRGKFKEFTIELGKGKNPGKFQKAAGPFSEQLDYQYIVRLKVQDVMRGSDDWVLRIRAVDENGQEHFASTPLSLEK